MAGTMRLIILALILTLLGRAASVEGGVLLTDDFSAQALDTSKWKVNVPTGNYFPFGPSATANSSVTQQSGTLQITGRGYLITNQEFTTPIQISGDATFASILGGAYQMNGYGGDSTEFLDIGLRTSAIPDVNYFREQSDGLSCRVTVTPTANGVGANPSTLMIWNRITRLTIGYLPSSSLLLGQGDSVHFTVTDDGQQVTFTVAKLVGGLPSDTIRDTVSASSTLVGAHNYVDYYTREDVNTGVRRTVALDNLSISSIPEPRGLVGLATVTIALLTLGRGARRIHRG